MKLEDETRQPNPCSMLLKSCILLFSSVLTALIATPVFAVEVGASAPSCALTSIQNDPINELKSYAQGKVLVLDFWASWCGPCLKSMPFWNSLRREYSDQDVEIIGINVDEELDDAKTFLAKVPADFAIAHDTQQTCAKAFALKAMPSTYFIDRQGIVRHVHLGFRESETSEISSLLKQLTLEK